MTDSAIVPIGIEVFNHKTSRINATINFTGDGIRFVSDFVIVVSHFSSGHKSLEIG